jgi:asparagine synthetase B (glutamine-hydrolysing)
MCGIFGCIGNLNRQLAEECTKKLRHRGPYGSGIWQQEGISLVPRKP